MKLVFALPQYSAQNIGKSNLNAKIRIIQHFIEKDELLYSHKLLSLQIECQNADAKSESPKKNNNNKLKIKKKSRMNKSFGFFIRDVDIQAICYELNYAPMFTQEAELQAKKNVVVRTEHLI